MMKSQLPQKMKKKSPYVFSGVTGPLGLLFSKFEAMRERNNNSEDCVFILVTQTENEDDVCERSVFCNNSTYLSFFGRALQDLVACVGDFTVNKRTLQEMMSVISYGKSVTDDVPLKSEMSDLKRLCKKGHVNVPLDIIKGVQRVHDELEHVCEQYTGLQPFYFLYFEVYKTTPLTGVILRNRVFYESNYKRSFHIKIYPGYAVAAREFADGINTREVLLNRGTVVLWLAENISHVLEEKFNVSLKEMGEESGEDEEEEDSEEDEEDSN